MNNKKTASELMFQICSYDHLGSAVNYEPNTQAPLLDFDFDRYSYFLGNTNTKILVKAIHERESCRNFYKNQFGTTTLQEILFNGYSLKSNTGSYTIPQAGGLPAMSLIVLSYSHKDRELKLYNYDPKTYELNDVKILNTPLEKLFYTKSINFNSVNHCIIIISDLQTLSKQYLARGFKFACFQAGHIAQNILLCAASLGIKAIPLGSLVENNITKYCLSSDLYP